MSGALVDISIEKFYNKASEETRLDSGMGVFEFERIKQLISQHITKEHAIIIDVGGGTGKYSEWLGSLGHKVVLIEPVEKHIKQAESRSKKAEKPFTIIKGNAQKLEYPSNFADLVILHGPLYHLQSATERKLAIQEAYRVLKTNGICLAFGINYTASTMAGLMNGQIHNREFFEMCRRELSSSLHNPPNSLPWLLAKGYYHKPEDLRAELLNAADFKYQTSKAVEGIIWLDSSYFTSMEIPQKRETLEELLKITEQDENLIALSPHFMVSVKK
ncbi:class I SAM-dependent methyltransferase [Ascidiimonas aurantiaca]|uniref:class I SAM-dependent methyltransferase n=1 Tax=Ascidiimonas aurantiaca TaxID=1685432 RepID=UPI0030ED8B05